MFLLLLKKELLLGLRHRSHVFLVLAFAGLSTLLFPMAIGPEPQTLTRIAPGLIWVILLFSAHIASPMIWQQDMEDGTLQELLSMNPPLEWIVLSKIAGVWTLYFSSLLLLTPLLGITLGLENGSLVILTISFLIASLPLSALTVTGALMTRGNQRAPALSSVIMLPLYLPLLIFSCMACEAGLLSSGTYIPLIMLGGVSLALCPLLLYTNVVMLKWTKNSTAI